MKYLLISLSDKKKTLKGIYEIAATSIEDKDYKTMNAKSMKSLIKRLGNILVDKAKPPPTLAK